MAGALARPRPGRSGRGAAVGPAASREQVALRRRRVAALVAPPLLIASTYLVFQGLVGWLGLRWGYLGGFLFFWGFWCVGFSPGAFLGLVYGWIALRTGTIRYTIVAHILLNAMGLSFAMLLLGQ